MIVPSEISFFCPGEPVSQGSKRHVGNGIMVESSKKHRPWRAAVTDAARQVFGAYPPLEVPLALTCNFQFVRPKSHFKTGKNSGVFRDDAPKFKSSAPDTDKLLRSICDSLADAGVVRNDSQFVRVLGVKTYGDKPGVFVCIEIA